MTCRGERNFISRTRVNHALGSHRILPNIAFRGRRTRSSVCLVQFDQVFFFIARTTAFPLYLVSECTWYVPQPHGSLLPFFPSHAWRLYMSYYFRYAPEILYFL